MTENTEPLTLQDLQAQVARGDRPKFLFFWGHRPEADGRIGKGCLSQWWPASFEVAGTRYASAEHFMMAEKARLFGDEATRARVLAARSPAEAKKLGRLVAGFTESAWVEARFGIVQQASLAKFSQDEALRDYLLGTGQRVLVEASPVDAIWGIGMAADHAHIEQPGRWRGLNLLGFALMAARAQLAAG